MITAIMLFIAFFLLSSILFGAPYVPVHKVNQKAVFDLLELKKGETFVDLGSGDGRMLRQAASLGVKAIGYEINPVLWFLSTVLCLPKRKNITIKLRNFFYEDLSKADAIVVFLDSRFIAKLERKLEKESKKQRVACIAYNLPTKVASKEKDGVFLYNF